MKKKIIKNSSDDFRGESKKTPEDLEGAELCEECGTEMIYEEGKKICPDCDTEIDFFGEDDA